MAIPVAVVGLLKSIAIKAVMKKVEKEIVKIDSKTDDSVKGTVGAIEETLEVSKGKAAIWGVGIALLTFAASQGWIDASLANAIIEFVSDPAVQDAVESAVE